MKNAQYANRNHLYRDAWTYYMIRRLNQMAICAL